MPLFLLAACLAPLGHADSSATRALADVVGIYHWGGSYASSISGGVNQVANLGDHLVRITLTARAAMDYNQSTSCQAPFSLSHALDDSDLRASLANPALNVIMITAYDGVSFADCKTASFLNPDFYTPEHTAAMLQEYSDFVVALHQIYQGSGKRFIISNWEGDNSIYCDAAYAYATDDQFRGDCDASYSSRYNGNLGPRDSLEGMVRWLHVRWRGIQHGKARAAQLGFEGVEVLFAPEFSIVHALQDHGLPSVLYDVLPRVRFDYVSYSSYESIDTPDPAPGLRADLDLIRNVAGTSQIILGEMGYARSLWGNATVPLTATVEAAAMDWGVAYIFQWNLYDQDPVNNLGLFDLNGAITPLGQYYVTQFGPD